MRPGNAVRRLVTVIAIALATEALAQQWPGRSINVVSPFAVGTTNECGRCLIRLAVCLVRTLPWKTGPVERERLGLPRWCGPNPMATPCYENTVAIARFPQSALSPIMPGVRYQLPTTPDCNEPGDHATLF
jgi:hypothetical protein